MMNNEQHLICFCFGYTLQDIAEDIRCNGRSMIMDTIIREKQAGNCSCLEKNPRGR